MKKIVRLLPVALLFLTGCSDDDPVTPVIPPEPEIPTVSNVTDITENGTPTTVSSALSSMISGASKETTYTVNVSGVLNNADGQTISVPQTDNTLVILNFEKAPTGTSEANPLKVEAAGLGTAAVGEAKNELKVSVPASATDVYLDVNTPTTTVTVEGTYKAIAARTATNTLVVTKGTVIDKLVVNGGNVIIEAGGTVTVIERTEANADKVTVVKMEDGSVLGNLDEVAENVQFKLDYPNMIIKFTDATAKQICVTHWDTDGDGELSVAEAAAVKELNREFYISEEDKTVQQITSFNEFRYFTGLTIIPTGTFTSWTGLKSITLPESIVTIEGASFRLSGLTEIVIPAGVKTIGGYAFLDNASLKKVSISATVETIESTAFGNCAALENITVDADNKTYDSRDNSNAIIETATNTLVVGCQTTKIPASVTRIGDSAFYGQTGVATLPDLTNITSVGASAFSGTGITGGVLNVPAGLTEIGAGAFPTSLDGIVVAAGNPTYDSRENCNALVETATNTMLLASKGNKGVIPSSIKALANYLFEGMTGFDHVNIPAGVELGQGVFSRTDVKSATLPEGLTTIPASLFYYCQELVKVNIPSTVTVIEQMAFNQNHALEEINFPEGLTEIGNYAFTQCFALKSIDLPSTIKSLGSLCFDGCQEMTSITIRATTPPTAAFSPISGWTREWCPIYVPAESIEAYQTTAPWSQYADRYEPIKE